MSAEQTVGNVVFNFDNIPVYQAPYPMFPDSPTVKPRENNDLERQVLVLLHKVTNLEEKVRRLERLSYNSIGE